MDEVRKITDDFSDIDTTDLLQSLPNYFEFSGDILNSAYLTWRFDAKRDVEIKFYELGKAYFTTAFLLIDTCLANNRDKKADTWIFPIMFHIVHGIEVYLKGFLSQYAILTKLKTKEYQASDTKKGHEINDLCDDVLDLLLINDDKVLHAEYTFVRKFIEILYENTNDMTFARYPKKNNKTDHFYVSQTGNITIDLNVFKAWVVRVFQIVDSSTGFIDFQIDELKEKLYKEQHGEEFIEGDM